MIKFEITNFTYNEPMSFDNLTNQFISGNRRFSTNRLLYSNQDTSRGVELASDKKPFAAFLCCSDSRVPLETIFVCGLGCALDGSRGISSPMKSWAVLNKLSNLGVKIIIVLGHKLCAPCKGVLTGGIHENTGI